jgi:hypothetical protein
MFNVFGDLALDLDDLKNPLTSYEYVEFLEEGGGTSAGQLANKTNDLRIRMTDRDLVTLPADSFVHCVYTIALDDGAQLGALNRVTSGNVAPVNNGWNTFKRTKYLLSNSVAEDIYRPGYVRQVKSLIEYDDDYEKGQGQNELFMPDRIYDDIKHGTFKEFFGDELRLTAQASQNGLRIIQINALAGTNAGDPVIFTFRNDEGAFSINQTDETIAFSQTVNGPALTTINVDDGNDGDRLTFGDVIGGRFIKFYDQLGKEGYFIKDAGILKFVNVDGSTHAITRINGVSSDYPNFSKGFEKRKDRLINKATTEYTNSISLYMPLRRVFPLLAQNPIVMRGIEQELNFDLNDAEDILFRDRFTNGNSKIRVILQRLSWWVPVLKPKLEIMNAMNNMLNSGSKRDLVWDNSNHYYSEPRLDQSGSWLIKTTEHRPVRCYVFLQEADKFKNQLKNNMVFDNYDLNRIFIRVNSDRQFPNKEYVINYNVGTEQDYSRVYKNYLDACSAVHSDSCKPSISYHDFKDLYPLYYFDLSSQDEGVWESTTQAHITVEYYLNTAPTSQFRIHAVLDTQRKITLRGVNGRMTRVQ